MAERPGDRLLAKRLQRLASQLWSAKRIGKGHNAIWQFRTRTADVCIASSGRSGLVCFTWRSDGRKTSRYLTRSPAWHRAKRRLDHRFLGGSPSRNYMSRLILALDSGEFAPILYERAHIIARVFIVMRITAAPKDQTSKR